MRTAEHLKGEWIQLETHNAPSPRATAAIAYDEVRANVVLFGGFNCADGCFGNTWIFNGSNWTEVHPTRRPPPERATNNLCWCPHGEQLVLR